MIEKRSNNNSEIKMKDDKKLEIKKEESLENNLKSVGMRLDYIEATISKFSVGISEVHDWMIGQKAVQDNKKTIIAWLSRNLVPIVSAIMVLGVVMWELKKSAP